MRTFLIKILILTLSLFTCCKSNNPQSIIQGSIIKKQLFYENGNLKMEMLGKLIEKDTIPHGVSKLYYPNGNLKMEVNYVNGKKQGRVTSFYEDGSLESVGWYNNDEKDSLWVSYYNYTNAKYDEPFKSFSYWNKGQPINHYIEYYPNGNIQNYFFYNPIGEPIYGRHYDEYSNYQEEGDKRPQIVMINNKNNQFTRDDTLIARVYYISPPNVEAIVYVRIRGLNEKWEMLSSIEDPLAPIFLKRNLPKIGYFILEIKLCTKENAKISEFINQLEFSVR